MSERPILIAGAGAIGSVIGAMLRGGSDDAARRRHDVALLGRERHLDTIARDGLRISGIFGEHVARGFIARDRSGAPRRTVRPSILLAVKAYDTEAIADRIAHLLAPDGLVVSMQNGVGNLDVLVERFGAARVIGARVMLGAEIPAPGTAHATVFGEPLALGPSKVANREHCAHLVERAREVAAMISAAGLPAEAVEDIRAIGLWMKLFYNAALNPLGALLRLSYGALAADADLRTIMDEVIEEAFAVAIALKVPLPATSSKARRRGCRAVSSIRS